MAETRQERQQRFSQRDMERQAKEDAIKRGLGSFGPQAAWLAGLMAPSSGITDTLGLYPADTSGSGEKLPSFGENIQNKQYLDAFYQGLGLAGDAMYASTPFTGAVGILGGTALKGMGAVGKASRAGNKMIVHGTTKDAANIIRQEGEINPRLGSFVEDMYITRGDYGSLEPHELPPTASFHTSIDDPSGAISAMESQIGYKLGKPYDDISLKEIEEHGSIILSEVEPSLAFKYADDEMNIVNLKGERVSIDEPLGFESEDIISFYPVEPSRILEGKDLVAFVKSHDPKWNMQQQELPFGKASKPIKAYHGSPHDFEKFDIGKMGSGEGFQAYGRGIYFAEAEDVAKVYRDALSRRQVFYDGKPIKFRSARELENSTGDSEIDTALMMMQEHRETPEEFIKYMEDQATDNPSMKDFYQQWAEKIRKVKDKITLTSRGKVYETDIHVTPDELLDWGKPLSEQPKAVLEKIAKLDPEVSHELMVSQGKAQGKVYETSTGEDLYAALDVTLGETDGIEALDEVGIKGIKYFDAFSRGTEGGTSNYVIFDTRILDIANKYGVAIPVAGAMLLSIDKGEKAIEGGRKDI